MFPALGAVLGLLQPVAGGVLRKGLKFQTCTNTLNNFFLTIPGIFGSSHVCGNFIGVSQKTLWVRKATLSEVHVKVPVPLLVVLALHWPIC